MPGSLPLYDAAALRRVEAQAAAALGGDDFELMRRAGRAAWRAALAHWPGAQRIVVACGPGNNGGDGHVFAGEARASGRAVTVVHPPDMPARSPLARRACTAFVEAGGEARAFDGRLPEADLVVDALFGIGLSRAPDASAAALIEAIGASGLPVLALDAPSGIDADTGHRPGAAIRATRTLEFLAAHPGLRTAQGPDHAGLLETASLDVPDAGWEGVRPSAQWLRPARLRHWLPSRRRDSHKGAFGHVLCIGGDAGMGGAIVLCCEAALRAGAGLVSAATRAAHLPALLARRPECMAHAVDAADALPELLRKADVVAIGPGLGRGDWGRALFETAIDAALRARKALVIDADALNLLARAPRALPCAVLTPHPGEAARLLGCDTAAVQADRFDAVARLAARFQCAVVLKGAGSLVAAPDRIPQVVGAGNPGMATGGMGDVLTGIVSALLAQGLDAFDAAACGALLHAHAGDLAAGGGERGLLPSDLLACLRAAANPMPTTEHAA